jgi:hypothetical protein
LNLICHSFTVTLWTTLKSSQPLSSFICIFLLPFSSSILLCVGARFLSRPYSICRYGNVTRVHCNASAKEIRIGNQIAIRSLSANNAK